LLPFEQRVEIGMQRWFDKAALAAVAVILSSGLLLALPALGSGDWR
jgi:putative copper export protein